MFTDGQRTSKPDRLQITANQKATMYMKITFRLLEKTPAVNHKNV